LMIIIIIIIFLKSSQTVK